MYHGLSPRVRGNHCCDWLVSLRSGSIPACAGEPAVSEIIRFNERSIPACAGEPRWVLWHRMLSAVYPRVCGGTSRTLSAANSSNGLSPRVRGNPQVREIKGGGAGSIPACAGEPSIKSMEDALEAVYPRVCGGTLPTDEGAQCEMGLSPRVRGNHVDDLAVLLPRGSIPACAGEPLAL